MIRKLDVVALLAALSLSLAALPALAQSDPGGFPKRPVRVILPFGAGGFTDVITRFVTERLREKWGQPVIIENRAGATGTIGSNVVAKSPPDGHTLLVTVVTHTITPGVMKSLPYDAVKDFDPITILAYTQNLLLVRPDSPIRTLADVVNLARAKPGQVSFSTSGYGTGTHLMMALFEAKTGVSLNHVPYKGSPAALQAALAGDVNFTASSVSGAIPLLASKSLIPFAVGGERRSGLLPNVPTFEEAGFPGVLGVDGWVGMLAPAGTPQAVINKIYTDVSDILDTPEAVKFLPQQGLEKIKITPAQFAARIAFEIRELTRISKAYNITTE